MTKEEQLDDILDKFYDSKVAKDMGHITGVERWCIEAVARFMIDIGYMTPDMVKGLMFAVQAKKCSQCPKNQEGS